MSTKETKIIDIDVKKAQFFVTVPKNMSELIKTEIGKLLQVLNSMEKEIDDQLDMDPYNLGTLLDVIELHKKAKEITENISEQLHSKATKYP